MPQLPLIRTDFGSRCAGQICDLIGSHEHADAIAKVINDERAALVKAHAGNKPVPKVARDAIFDAIVTAVGLTPGDLTKSRCRTIATVVKELLEVDRNVSANEVLRRARAYKTKHPTWPITETALAKHWAEFGSGGQTNAAKRDIYCEPPGWRERIRVKYPAHADAMLSQWESWLDIPTDYRVNLISG